MLIILCQFLRDRKQNNMVLKKIVIRLSPNDCTEWRGPLPCRQP